MLVRGLSLALVLWMPFDFGQAQGLTPEQKAWLEDDSYFEMMQKIREVNEGDLQFVASFDARTAYHMKNEVMLNAQSLETGWGDMLQCHYNLDAVSVLEIVYGADTTKSLALVSQSNIERAQVSQGLVRLEGLKPGAQVCISGRTHALQKQGQQWVFSRGPFMRKFLDGYYPLQIDLKVSWPENQLRLTETTPESSIGYRRIDRPGEVQVRYQFEGRLQSRFVFEAL
jgi:hypothetical protein